MNLKELLTNVYKELNNVGVSVAYARFADDEIVYLPYIIFNVNKNIISADSDIYIYDYEFNVELYTHYKDLELDEQFRKAIYNIKRVVDYEESVMNGYILTRARFNLIREEKQPGDKQTDEVQDDLNE